MDLDDRRFFVLDISSHRKEDVQYFKLLELQMHLGGVNALLFDLYTKTLQISTLEKCLQMILASI